MSKPANPSTNNDSVAAFIRSLSLENTLERRKANILDQIEKHSGRLFRHDPTWHSALWTSLPGRRIMSTLLSEGYLEEECFSESSFPPLMRLCLMAQSIIQSDPSQAEELLDLILQIPDALSQAILHYIHPSQAAALAQLQASMPPSYSPPQMPPSTNIPPAALRLLFPRLDPAKFAPQFDWLMYLLSQFSARCEDDDDGEDDGETEEDTLSPFFSKIVDPNSLYGLKPGFSIDTAFVHNQLLNSYEEFLQHKLPQAMEQLAQPPSAQPQTTKPQTKLTPTKKTQPAKQPQVRSATTPTAPTTAPTATTTAALVMPPIHTPPNSILFPYFPKPHPLRRPFKSYRKCLYNLDFLWYVTLMFVLGPTLNFPATFLAIKFPKNDNLTFFIRTKLYTLKYRAWYAVTNSQTLTATTPTNITMVDQTPSTSSQLAPQPQPQPRLPDFSNNPAALVQLILLPISSNDLNLSLQPGECSTERFKTLIKNMRLHGSAPQLLFRIAHHCFPDPTVRDSVVNEVVMPSILNDPSAFGNTMRFSRILQKNGFLTLYQYAYRQLLNQLQPDNDQPISFDQIHPILYDLFQTSQKSHMFSGWLPLHINFCIHAGLLSPLPPPPPPQSITPQQATNHALLAEYLFTFRTLIISCLVKYTGFISYFPQSTQLLATAINTVTPLVSLSTPDLTLNTIEFGKEDWATRDRPFDPPFVPPHCRTVLDPRDALSTLDSALVDDDGKLYAIKFKGSTTTKPTPTTHSASSSRRLKPKSETSPPWWDLRFPFPGAPRHRHLHHRAVIDELRFCFQWDSAQLAKHPELLVDLNSSNNNPDSRPLVSAEDSNWINSEPNQALLNTADALALQTELTAYYRAVGEFETKMVIDQMHKVLLKAGQAGLLPLGDSASPHHHNPVYPLPSDPDAPTCNHDERFPYDALTFNRKRFVLKEESHSCHVRHDEIPFFGTHSFTDYHYRPFALIMLDPPSTPAEVEKRSNLPNLFREVSEWALELLIMLSFGLQPPAPPLQPQTQAQISSTHPVQQESQPQQAPPTDTDSAQDSARIQHCKEQILHNFPTHLDALQPALSTHQTTTMTDSTDADTTAQTHRANFHGILSRLTLLAMKPLFETLRALPATTPPLASVPASQ